jgi:hypothetical protein
LIHPGRLLRLKESVTNQSATIARSLVEMTVADVEAKKKEEYGFTAQQIAKKIEQDPTSMSILPHLLAEMKAVEIQRLLTKVVPERYQFCLNFEEEDNSRLLLNLGRCFRLAFDAATDEVKTEVTNKFVSVIKEESESVVRLYETVFFRGSDLAHVQSSHRVIVKAHLLEQLNENPSADLITACRGLGSFLDRKELADFTYAVMKAVAHDLRGRSHQAAESVLLEAYRGSDEDRRGALRKSVKVWADWWEEKKNDSALARTLAIRAEILQLQLFTDDDVPF